jgi:hypothetical protein
MENAVENAVENPVANTVKNRLENALENAEPLVLTHRYRHYVIESGAELMPTGNNWQPTLTIRHMNGGRGNPPVQQFGRIPLAFEEACEAEQYAHQFARQLIDDASPLLTI